MLALGSSVGFSHPGLSVWAKDKQFLPAGEQWQSTPVWLRPSKLIPFHGGFLPVEVLKACRSPPSRRGFIQGSCTGFSACCSKGKAKSQNEGFNFLASLGDCSLSLFLILLRETEARVPSQRLWLQGCATIPGEGRDGPHPALPSQEQESVHGLLLVPILWGTKCPSVIPPQYWI